MQLHYDCKGLHLDTHLRYFVDVADLPEDYKAASGNRLKRSCIYDHDEETPRMEAAWKKRCTAFVWLDRGANSWPSRSILMSECGLRMVRGFDVFHTRSNGTTKAYSRCGLGATKTALAFVTSFLRGPWHSGGHGGKYGDAAKQLHKNLKYDSSFFQCFYPMICSCWWGSGLPANYGSKDHMKEVWNNWPAVLSLEKVAPAEKGSRWYSTQPKIRNFAPDWAVLLMVGVYIGVLEGWLKSAEALLSQGVCAIKPGDAKPDCAPEVSSVAAASSSSSSSGAPPAPPPAPIVIVGAEKTEKTTVQDSGRFMQKFDRSGKSGPMLAVETLSCLFTRRVGLILARVPMALEAENLRTVTDLSTQKGCLDWHSKMANAEYEKYVGELLGVFQDKEFLIQVGFRMHACDKHNSDYFDEKELATLIADLVRESVALELQPMRVLCGPWGLTIRV